MKHVLIYFMLMLAFLTSAEAAQHTKALVTLPYDTFTAGKPIFAFQEVANNIALREGCNKVESAQIVNGTIQTADIADNAITADKLADSISLSMPIGTLLPFAAASISDSSYLVCNGQTVSRTTYAGLFAVIGSTYGGGDGLTTFQVPDLRARVIVGVNPTVIAADAGDTNDTRSVRTIGDTGGVQTLSEMELPAHDHTTYYQTGGAATGFYYTAGNATVGGTLAEGAMDNTGGTKQDGNMQPFITMNYIIYCGIVN